jgi:hypothetical protein
MPGLRYPGSGWPYRLCVAYATQSLYVEFGPEECQSLSPVMLFSSGNIRKCSGEHYGA